MTERRPLSLQTMIALELLDGELTRDEIAAALQETYGDRPTPQELRSSVGALQSTKLVESRHAGETRKWGTSRYRLSPAGRDEAVRRWSLVRRLVDGGVEHERLRGRFE